MLSKKIYSDVIFVFSIVTLLHFQPNSGETIFEFLITVSLHSLNNFIPSKSQLSIRPLSEYHIGALVLSSKVECINSYVLACHKGYLKENLLSITLTFLVSFSTDSPSCGPAKVQFLTSVSFKLYNALSSSKV